MRGIYTDTLCKLFSTTAAPITATTTICSFLTVEPLNIAEVSDVTRASMRWQIKLDKTKDDACLGFSIAAYVSRRTVLLVLRLLQHFAFIGNYTNCISLIDILGNTRTYRKNILHWHTIEIDWVQTVKISENRAFVVYPISLLSSRKGFT